LFSKQELIDALEKCNNSSAPGPDKLTWSHIKFVDIANLCIGLGHWPSHFKTSNMIVIPKPNKSTYDSPKSYQLIVLLNMIGKLFEKIIEE